MVIGLTLSTVMSQISGDKVKGEQAKNIADVRQIIVSTLMNEDAFKKTLNNSQNDSAFACIRNKANCQGATGEFLIFDKNNVQLTLSTRTGSASGFSSKGAPCNSFTGTGPGTGNDQCPFQYVAKWEAYCPKLGLAGTTETYCRNPILKINVKLKFSPASTGSNLNKIFGPINLDKASINIVKSEIESDPLKLCQMISPSATLLPDGTCFIPALITTCAGTCGASPGRVAGFNPDGSVICGTCTPLAETVCSPGSIGQVLETIDANGNIVCHDGVVPGLPPAAFSQPIGFY
jgi:hypothetical protein